ncbi:hypothetical protein EON66_05525 [archaeon]|nr:MAG: hypothetical protein EON66_05525 [archaeon]
MHDDGSARWLEHVQAKNMRVPLSSDDGLPMERVSTASVLRLVRDAKEEAEASEASLAKVAVHTSAGTLASNAFVADVPTQVFLAAPLPEPRATLTARPPTGRKVGPARGGAATGGSRSTASSRGGAAPLAVPLQFSAGTYTGTHYMQMHVNV